jgi:hypothetical protein
MTLDDIAKAKPDWDRVAVYSDWLEDHDDMVLADGLRWMRDNRRWPNVNYRSVQFWQIDTGYDITDLPYFLYDPTVGRDVGWTYVLFDRRDWVEEGKAGYRRHTHNTVGSERLFNTKDPFGDAVRWIAKWHQASKDNPAYDDRRYRDGRA